MEDKDDFNPLVRIQNADVDGNKVVSIALTKIKGVSHSFSNAICNILSLNKFKKSGYISNEELSKIEDVITNPGKHKIPTWMLNRRKDYASGEDLHLVSGNLKYIQENDIRRLQRVKSRRGLRHAWKLPVRGQRTRSNFRKGKSLGVKRKR